MGTEVMTEAPEVGHNSIAANELRSFVERVERLEEDRRQIGEDIKDVFTEMKGRGYDPRVVKALIKLRRGDKDEQAEFYAVLQTYANALGMQMPLPL